MNQLGREVHAPGAATHSIPLAVPNIGGIELDAVAAAVASGFVSSIGPDVTAFEDEFASLVGAGYAVACSSGTAAIHLALLLLGIGEGDEVACSDFTFIGSVNPIAYVGARALLVDSERETWNLDPDLLRDELTRRTASGAVLPKAVEMVHILGQPAQAERLLDVCDEFRIPVIEDAAESLGSGWSVGRLAGRQSGAVGAVGCYSFNGNKIVTAGGGGMIVTDDPALAERARHLATQAKVPDIGYLHDEVGYNYRLTNLAAALGRAQLGRLDEFVSAKRRIAATYDREFADLPVTLPPRLDGHDSTYWLYSLLTPSVADRDALLRHLDAHDVGARAMWRPIHSQPPFANCRRLGGEVGQDLFLRGVSLPCSTTLTEEEQSTVIAAVRSYFV